MKSPTELPTVPRSASDEHDFYVLGSRGFEHLVRALHGAQTGVTIAHLYGPDGQAQFGADHVAFLHEDGEAVIEVGQSKAYKRFAAAQIREAVKDFTDHWESHWRDKKVRRFILFVGCVIKSRQAQDEIIAQTQALAQRGVAFEVWDASTIYDKLGSAPGVVRVHLGQEYYAKLFGETVGPLTGLQRDLQRGDRGALQVGGYVARLNRAETAEVAQLRRRARRGETQEVVEELEDMLFRSPAAQAAAPETRAQQLRLLAGLLIRRDEHVRVKRLLDEADGLDGDSRRLRALLVLEAVGPQAALAETQGNDEVGVAEVRAVARLRQSDPDGAFGEIAPYLATDEPPAETLRLAALSKLLRGEREEALSLGERAAVRDPDSRACRQVLGIAHYHRALSPAAGVSVGEWPEPIEQPLVATSDEAREHLEQAERIFSKLKADPSLDDHQSMVIWHFAALACMPWRREEAVAVVRAMEASDTLLLPLIAWCMARGLDFDSGIAVAACASRLAEAPDDLETRLIAVAVNTFRRDQACARRLLEEGREQLLAQGNKAIHDYWSAVLDLQTRRPASADALVEHPSLRLRQAFATRSKKKRLAALEQLLLDQLGGEGDPPVILTATQLLLQGGWHRTAAKAAPYLVQRIATGEALAVAARALYHNGRFREAGEALDRTEEFPGGRLPVELERLRAESLAASGNLIAARKASVELASATGNEGDIWRSIEFHLASGDEHSALALYDRHEDVLAKPAPGHVMLARAVLHTNREAAARITRQIAQATPDELVTAVFDLAAKLRLQAEQNTLVGRMAALGATGGGGVQMLHVDEVVTWIKRRNEQIDETFEKYANGHLPAHMMASFREGALALTHLSPLLRPPTPDVRLPILSARYGRRHDDGIWPERREDVVLIADVTALLTAHGLDLLDTVERYFKPIHVALDISNALLALRSDVEPAQPERVAAMRRVVARIEEGGIAVRGPAAQIDAFTVLFELEGREPEATLNLHRLMEPILAGMAEAKRNSVSEALGTTLYEAPAGAVPPPGRVVNIDETMAVTLEQAGALGDIAAAFQVTIDERGAAHLRFEIDDAERRERTAASLTALGERIGIGLTDGTYQNVPVSRPADQHLLRRCVLQVMEAVPIRKGILWVDDRFVSAIDSPNFPVATTAEVLGALRRFGRIDRNKERDLRARLRAARWQFLPIETDEMIAVLRPATRNGKTTENEPLAALRRAAGNTLRERRRLQWPDPAAAMKGARGEVPFLLDTGHAVTQALAEIWDDDGWSIEDASAASGWILDHLDFGLFPLTVLASGDPRSDHLLGTHIGSLLLSALQIRPGRPGDPRRAAFLEWLMDYLVRNSLKVRPEIRASLEEMIEGILVQPEEDAESQRRWSLVAGNALNAMPEDLRAMMIARPAIRARFELPDHGQLTIGRHDFDEMVLWNAIASAGTAAVTLKNMEAEPGEICLLREDEPKVQLTIGGDTFLLDPWPWLISRDDRDVRLPALEAKAVRLDLSRRGLDELNADLGPLAPVERIRHLIRRERESAGGWYEDLRERAARRQPFKMTDLLPDDLQKIARLLRLEEDVEEGAAALISEHRLSIALRRFGGLPIKPPRAIASAIEAMDETQLQGLLAEAEIETAPPWTKLFLAAVLTGRPSGAGPFHNDVRGWIDAALSKASVRQWRLYIALAQFICRERVNAAVPDGPPSIQQLAACWLHASSVAEIMIEGRVAIDKLIKFLNAERFSSPRHLVDAVIPFTGDRSDPRRMNHYKLMAHAAASSLAAYAEDEGQRAWAHAHMISLASKKGKAPETRIAVAEGGLLRGDLLGSHVATDWSEAFEAAAPGLGAIFGRGLEALVGAVLAVEADQAKPISPWPFVRFASGEAPLPPELAEQARAAVRFPLPEEEDIVERYHVLLSLTQVAAANGWTEIADQIETALYALDPDGLPEGDPEMIPLEIAIHHALIERGSLARTKALGRHLTRLAAHQALRPHVEQAARHFARFLSGQQTEAFVDVLAELWSSK